MGFNILPISFFQTVFPTLLFILTSIFSWATDGWEHIRKNDYKNARADFLSVLEKDSANLSALKGMIYLSETSGDDLSYSKYVNRLINNHWIEPLFILFGDEYSGADDKIISQQKLSKRAKLPAILSKASNDYYFRKFIDSKKTYDEVFGNYLWTYIGPFKNLGGSGYETNFELENETYNADKAYQDEDGATLKWVNPPSRNNQKAVTFSDYLKYNRSAVYFANLFFTVPADRTVQLRITRKDPIKIWLDDELVYENNDNTSFEWDNEIVQLNLEAGSHRLLVKLADYYTSGGSSYNYYNYDFSDLFSSYSSYGSYNSQDYFGFRRKGSSAGDFTIRITDAEGNLMQDIKTETNSSYQKKKYKPELLSFFVINHLKNEIQKNPDDLFNYFALALAYQRYSNTTEGEEAMIKFLRKNKNLVLAKYLAFKMYFQNGKKEIAYEAMGEINQDETPLFALLFEKFLEIDKKNDEDKYLASLEHLAQVSPANMKVIRRFIEYYDSKGEQEKKEEYIKEKMKQYPEYKDVLKEKLKEDLAEKKKAKKESYKADRQQSYSKDIRRLKKDVKKYFYEDDYYDLIDHYQSKDDNAMVMSLYDELMKIQPYESEHLYEKSLYLFEEERYDECIATLQSALRFKPYQSEYYELIGDAYFEKKEKDKALEFFKEADKYGSSYSNIKFKIEKIEGQKQYKKLFKQIEFRDILQQEDWKEKYKDEDAVVLLYAKDQVYTPDRETEIYQKFMAKILTDAGTKKWIEYDFSFLGSIKSSRIIKKNGAEVIPDGRGGYKVFKNLEAGDIIQLEGTSKYAISANTIPNESYSFTYLNFEVPVHYEKYEVAVPEGKYLGYLHHKVPDSTQKKTENGFDFYKWEFRDVPALAQEDAGIDKSDHWARIMISTMPDWSKVVTWYKRKTYRKLEATYEVREAFDSIIKPGMSQREKVEAIYNHLTANIKYSYVPFLQSGYVPKSPGLTLCSRIGDCKDVATLMITMLRLAGIEAHYVLVKTNDYFNMKTLPSLYFNHAIVGYNLDGKMHFLDMTTDFYPYYIIPTMDADAWALLIKDGENAIFQLPKDNIDSVKNKAEIIIDAKLNSDRSTDLQVKATYRGSFGGNIRERFTQSNKDEQKNYILKMIGNGLFENLTIIENKFDNLLEISSPLTASYKLNAFNYCDRVATMLVCRIPYMTPVNTHAAILAKKRVNALDVKEIVSVEPTLQKVSLTFPDGYDLLEMPKDVNVESKYGTYRVSFKRIKNGLYVEKFQAFHMSVISEKEFEAFQKFYQSILDIDSTKLALKKK